MKHPSIFDFYPWQQKMVDSSSKIKWVQAGRRAGKTRSALMEAMSAIQDIAGKPVILPNS